MGKAKNRNDDDGNQGVTVDLKSVTALKPESRAKWLAKACKRAADGEVNVKSLYDVLSSRKICHEMHEKAGQRMLRTLRDNLWVFSEKQQRFLGEESPLALKFSAAVERSTAQRGGRSDDEDGDQQERRPAGARSSTGPSADDAAAKMEEMMARCRDFVRDKADSYEDRQLELQEVERRANAEQLRVEWDAIKIWHTPLEHLELACMVAEDDLEEERRLRTRAADKKRRRDDSSRSSSPSPTTAETAAVLRPPKKRKEKRRHHSSSSSS